ncbi:integrase core domain-containing protein, partial [Pseudomonas syringae]|uniref:integrase core domain-containing protein n=2 Tax=Pseudomonas syringae TaxID=317 RepID=UPI0024467DB0
QLCVQANSTARSVSFRPRSCFFRKNRRGDNYPDTGGCWDNAVMERFFLNLKMERTWRKDYANHGEAIKDITDYIVRFYNEGRLHSTLGYVPPNQYERQAA